jgi:hypothetical protein
MKKSIPQKSVQKKKPTPPEKPVAAKKPIPDVKAVPVPESVPEATPEPDVVGMAGVMLGDMEEVLKKSFGRMRQREALRPSSLEGVNRRIEEARDKLKVVREEIKRARIHLIASIHEEREVEAWMRSLEEMRAVFLDEE